MVCRHDVKAVLFDEESPDVAHDRLLTEESLICRGAAQKDHLRADKPELLSQEWLARMDLLRGRSSVLRRTAFGDIADVIVLLGESVGVDQVLEELAGSAYKRSALKVLLLAGSFTDYHERSLTAAPVDNDIGAPCPKAAVIARAAFSLELFPLCFKSVCHTDRFPFARNKENYTT